MMAVKKGDNVKVEYAGTLEDGSVFDSSEKHGSPLEFEAGAGNVIRGFDKAVIGMKKGEEKEISIEPADSYGERKEELVQEIPKDKMPKDQEIKKGMLLGIKLPNGKQLPGKIVRIDDKSVSIDFNHPLAGKKLKFKIKVVDVEGK